LTSSCLCDNLFDQCLFEIIHRLSKKIRCGSAVARAQRCDPCLQSRVRLWRASIQES